MTTPTTDLRPLAAAALRQAANLTDRSTGATIAFGRALAWASGGPQDLTDLGLELPCNDCVRLWSDLMRLTDVALHAVAAPPLERLPADWRGAAVFRRAADHLDPPKER